MEIKLTFVFKWNGCVFVWNGYLWSNEMDLFVYEIWWWNEIVCVCGPQWRITVPEGEKIRLTFSSFDLVPEACKDYVDVYDGHKTGSAMLGKTSLCVMLTLVYCSWTSIDTYSTDILRPTHLLHNMCRPALKMYLFTSLIICQNTLIIPYPHNMGTLKYSFSIIGYFCSWIFNYENREIVATSATSSVLQTHNQYILKSHNLSNFTNELVLGGIVS